jgi:cytochrome c
MLFHSIVILLAVLLLSGTAETASPASDPSRGAVVFRQCAACHSLEPGLHLTGPSLARIFGRKAGMMGDRAFIVFSSPEEMATLIEARC